MSLAPSPLDEDVPTESEYTSPDGSGEPAEQEEISPEELERLKDDHHYLDLSERCVRASVDWFDSTVRTRMENAWHRFHGRHEPGSKYNDEFYAKRSRLFPPKTREGLRKIEAAIGAAYFSTADAVHCSALNDANDDQRDLAEICNALLYFRLVAQSQMGQGGIPWFTTLLGGAQEAMSTGVVCSRQNWRYLKHRRQYTQTYIDATTGEQATREEQREEEVTNQPAVTLVPIENLHISPACDWMDPIGSSPYVIEDMPMEMGEIRRRMSVVNPQTGESEYRPYSEGVLSAYVHGEWDTLQQARDGATLDKYEALDQVPDYETVWIRHCVVRGSDGLDYVYDTLGDKLMLSHRPRPLEAVYLHKMRPWSLGFSVLESQNVFPHSVSDLASQLQEQTTDLENLKLDAVKLRVNPRWKVQRGGGVDTRALMRNVPSGLVAMNSINSVDPLVSAELPQSAFAEGDRVNLAIDSMFGNMSQTTIGATRNLGDTVGGLNLLSSDANEVKEYVIRTLSESWIEQVVRQLVALELAYETGELALQVAGDRTGLTQDRILQLLQTRPKGILVACAVGFGATSPVRRLERLSFALEKLGAVRPDLVQQMDGKELVKEVFGAVGYKDGARFFPQLFSQKQDPQVQQLQQKVQELEQFIQQQGWRIQVEQVKGDNAYRLAQLAQQKEYTLAQFQAQIDAKNSDMKHQLDQLDRMIDAEDQQLKKRELILEREALSHDIQESDRDFMLRVAEHHRAGMEGQEEGGASPKGNGKNGPPNLPGADKAGILARGNYGALPETLGPPPA